MTVKLPSFQFYPGDWMKDPALRACTIAARGIWIDMLSLMFESSRRGYLQHVTGKPVTAEQLARMTGCSTDEVSRLLQELEDAGVFSRTDSNVIFSRRMSRDERKRALCQEAGKRGGNPTLKGQLKGDAKGTVKGQPKGDANRNPTPSSSSSSSTSSSEEEPPNPPKPGGSDSRPPPKPRNPKQSPESVPIPQRLDTPSFRTAWANWLTDRKVRSKTVTELSAEQQLAALEPIGPELAIECVKESIRNGWQGLFPEKFDTNKQPPSNTNGTRPTGPHRVEATPGKYAVPSKNSFVVPANADPISEGKPPANDAASSGSASGTASQVDSR